MLDGFWVHRWLVAAGVHNVVVEPSSIEVNRRARRAKTDRLDATKLLALLMRAGGGERVWSEVHVPSPEDEARRQLTREIEAVLVDRTRLRNRIKGLLATQGIRVPMTRRSLATLAAARTGDGRPLAEAWRQRIAREWAQLQAVELRLRTARAERNTQLAEGHDRVTGMIVMRHNRDSPEFRPARDDTEAIDANVAVAAVAEDLATRARSHSLRTLYEPWEPGGL